jgi:hypothetical protein
VRFSILINGSPSRFFGSSRGVREEDPLSSFLLIIVLEALSRMISATIDHDTLSGLSDGLDSPRWSTYITCYL